MDERNIETMDLEGYQIVRREQFAREDLWIDFNPAKKDHHIFISKVCMKHLGNPPYVTMLINPEEKNLILRPRWRKKDGPGRHAIRTAITLITGPEGSIIKSCEPMFRKIAEIAGWEDSLTAKHRVYGRAFKTNSGSSLLVFSLDEAEVFISAGESAPASPVTEEENR